jgi:hypothetical protein
MFGNFEPCGEIRYIFYEKCDYFFKAKESGSEERQMTMVSGAEFIALT